MSGRCEGVHAGIVVGVGSTPGIAVDMFAGTVSDVHARDGGTVVLIKMLKHFRENL